MSRSARPNRRYACTSGPDGKQCRRCEREKMRAANRLRAQRGEGPMYSIPALTQEETTQSRRNPCPCEQCKRNRDRCASYHRNAPQVTDEDLDRIALSRWKPEWGARA